MLSIFGVFFTSSILEKRERPNPPIKTIGRFQDVISRGFFRFF
jgi:hypothetical protein